MSGRSLYGKSGLNGDMYPDLTQSVKRLINILLFIAFYIEKLLRDAARILFTRSVLKFIL